MGLLKDAVGVVVSGTVTVVMFLGGPLLGLFFATRPLDMIDLLATPRREATIEGAWVQGPVELPGELDGNDPNAPETPPEDTPPDPETPPEPVGAPEDATGPVDPKSNADSVGGVVKADAVAPSGTRAGSESGEGTTRRPSTPRPTSARQQAQSRRKCEPTYEGIRRRADGTYEVDRALVNYHTASVKNFNELGWSQPNDKGDGKGWMVGGFGCNDALFHGGLRRGDVVLTVNGKKTNNMMQVFLLYSKVKAQRHFEVEILRKGVPLTLRYEIVKG